MGQELARSTGTFPEIAGDDMKSSRQKRHDEHTQEIMQSLQGKANTVRMDKVVDSLGNIDYRVKVIDYRGFATGGVSTPRLDWAQRDMNYFASLITLNIATRQVDVINPYKD